MPAVGGDKIVTVALEGDMGEGPVQGTANGDGYRLTGTRTQVFYGPIADAFLVPAETDSGTKVFLVDKDDAGVTVSRLAHGVPVGGELDYLDEGTLSAAIRSRTPV